MADLNTIGGIHYEMMRRCYNEKSVMFSTYGAVGIKVCNEWHNRESFRKWCLENGYKKGLRLERIDSSGNYEPENCRFGTKNTYKSGIGKYSREVRKHREEIKTICNVPKRYSHLRIYRIFVGMHSRCEIPSNSHYDNYGGRGICVCEEWSGNDGFFYFYKWSMENGYTNKLSIDRLDNNKGYSPDNCKWSTAKEQIENRRCSISLEYNGKITPLNEIAKLENLKYQMLYSRIKNGITLEKALEELRGK
jgi:hypothetical protein